MTGYGKAEFQNEKLTLSVEIKTVNNRFLDVSYKYPRSFTALQEGMRSALQKHLSRGKVDLYVNYKRAVSGDGALSFDEDLASSYVNLAKSLKKRFPSLKNDFTVTSLIKTPDVIKVEQEEIDIDYISPILFETVEKACENLNSMREFEGEKLKADMLSRIDTIESTVAVIKERAPLVSEDYRKRLYEKVQSLLEGQSIDEARLLQEVAIFADKCNIDEELTRLNSHVSQFRKICESVGEVGKKLDFLVQEFNRESNTICSKSNDVEVTDNALKLKCEIEKIREQIQNIE
jgi:uncharacterized protein (TIGR00255 family)